MSADLGSTLSRESRVPFRTLRLKWIGPRRTSQVRKMIPHPRGHKKKVGLGGSVSQGGKPRSPERSPVTSIITLRGDERDPIYNIEFLHRNGLRKKALSIRNSLRWIDTFKTPNGGLNVPFIDELGRITGHTLCKWSCDPRSLVASVISTIAKRLMKYCLRHNKFRIVRQNLRPIVGAAAYYAMTKDSHFWDRILYFARNLADRGTLIHRLRLFYSSKWSDHKRFVISQVIFQTHWLLSRELRPRDKLQFYSTGKRTLWRKPEDSPPKILVTNEVRSIAYALGRI